MAQIENVPVSHPVYHFIERYEAMGILPHFSTSDIPLSRKTVTEALKTIRDNKQKLTTSELIYLAKFEKEFLIKSSQKYRNRN